MKPTDARPARVGDRFGARVTATYGRNCGLVDDAGRLWSAIRRGRRNDVVVGDRIRALTAGPGQAAIESIEPRRSLLYRADAWRTKELAANIDQVVIVFASRPTFNLWFIWKALLAAHAAGIGALVVRNKADLDDGAEAARNALSGIDALGVTTVSVSARAEPDRTREQLSPLLNARDSLLVGESGMGKSTLLNLLVPDAGARTREFSERLDGGKQTTTAARWFALPAGGALVDTPGFSEFGLAHIDANALPATFADFAPYLGRCRFLDCRHLVEPDCAIRAAVDAGTISPARYAFYAALAREAT